MATITLTSLLARARTIASQLAIDANQSNIIDSRAGMMALLPNCILEVYRRYSGDPKFLRDVTSRNTIVITSGSGTMPDTILKEFMSTADITDDNNSLTTYYEYASDYNSSVNFSQLAYCYILGDLIKYTAPAPDFAAYSGNLYVTVPTMPAVASSITFQSEEVLTDIILLLARAIRGEAKFTGVDMQMAA